VFLVRAALSPVPVNAEEMDPISSARQAIETGDNLFAEGWVVPACLQYELAVGIAPQWWYPAYKKALCDMLQGDFKNAFYLLSKASTSRKELYVLHLALARWYRASDCPDKARREYETAIRLTKGAVEPMVELADLLVEQKLPGEARLVLKRAEYFSSTNFAIRKRLAGLSEQLGFLADAEQELRFLAARGVNKRRGLAELARFYQRRDEDALAQKVLQLLAHPREDGQCILPPARREFEGEAAEE